MAKGYQGRKKAEKAKTQLKSSMKAAGKADKKKKVKGQSGIRLPKGRNETKVDVKVKKVEVKGQDWLLEEQEEIVDLGGKKLRPVKVIEILHEIDN